MNDRSKAAVLLVGLVLGMLGVAFASVPLYRLFCQKTGYAGTPKIGQEFSTVSLQRRMRVTLTTDTHPGLPWEFKALVDHVDVDIGENALVFYRVRNKSDRPVTGMAMYNITPEKAAGYFVKVECFCFTNQRLEPGQSIDMPLYFYLDPAIVQDQNLYDLTDITLSYTFYQVKE